MNLQARVTGILTKPATEWPTIAAEATDVAWLYKNYILILAAIPAVCKFLGMTVIGMPFFGRSMGSFALVGAVMSYVISLVAVFIAAFVVEKLAPTFQSSGDTAQALKLVAYAYTPIWLAGVLYLIPLLGVLVLLAGLYAIYLFYLGMPPVMKTPADKVVVYMLVSAVVIIVVHICLAFLVGALTMAGAVSTF